MYRLVISNTIYELYWYSTNTGQNPLTQLCFWIFPWLFLEGQVSLHGASSGSFTITRPILYHAHKWDVIKTKKLKTKKKNQSSNLVRRIKFIIHKPGYYAGFSDCLIPQKNQFMLCQNWYRCHLFAYTNCGVICDFFVLSLYQ